ncbi:uncharacterized protein LOC101856820 [Aplysia californica]|uniref:Uncharacterized protein LOC101856820 n=1 Tax=Aplysia californica TaxID=6500 RepID=A0ABM0JVM1_APLCA|nr:uncharacterized protein LOC101856820 [Aplysia californica]
MSNHQLSPDDYSNSASERLSLRMPERKRKDSASSGNASSYWVIRNQSVLTWLTRLVFLLLTMANTAVIVASVLLMQDCREHLSPLKTLVPQSANFCTNLGMPALFACCITVFTVFGLGCTGRRLTGYALIVISSVEILQGVTTLTFYQCHRMSRHEVLDTINTSLTTCNLDAQLLWPRHTLTTGSFSLQSPSYSADAPVSWKSKISRSHVVQQLNVKSRRRFSGPPRQQRVNRTTVTVNGAAESVAYAVKGARLPSVQRGWADHQLGSDRIMNYALNAEDDTDSFLETSSTTPITTQQEPLRATKPPLGHGSNPDRLDELTTSSTAHQDDICSSDSEISRQISKRSPKSTLDKCISICQTYRSMCSLGRSQNAQKPTPNTRQSQTFSENGVPATSFQEMKHPKALGLHTGVHSPETKQDRNMGFVDNIMAHLRKSGSPKDVTQTADDGQAETADSPQTLTSGECEGTIYARVNHLCHYDNNVIIPLSMCAPLFNILMSLCFIYLADCDRKLKEALGDNGIFIKLPGSDNAGGRNGNACSRWLLWPCAGLFRHGKDGAEDHHVEVGDGCRRCGQKLATKCCPQPTDSLCCLPYRARNSPSQQYLSEYSTTYEERLQLKPLPSLQRTNSSPGTSAQSLIVEDNSISSLPQK